MTLKTVIATLLLMAVVITHPAHAQLTKVVEDGGQIQPNNLFPKVKFETSMGDFIVELNRHRARVTTNNFLRYAYQRAFEGIIFQRVIEDFVVQGGMYDEELNDASTYPAIPNESGNGLKNDMYTIAMATQPKQPHSATRQFFFNMRDNDSLNPGKRWGYAVFGYVTEGTEVLDEMSMVETTTSTKKGWTDFPVKPIVIKKVHILPEEDE